MNFIRLFRSFVDSMPSNSFGNWIYFTAYFVYSQRRWPRRIRRLVNDRWFSILTGPECMDVLRQFTTDKEFVKIYVTAKLGKEFCVPTLAILSTRQDLDAFVPDVDCVIKPAHNSQIVLFIKAQKKISFDSIEALEKTLKENRGLMYREANYKYLRPRLIAEPMIADPKYLVDYKIFCRKGDPKIIQVDIDRHGEHRQAFFDTEWQKIPVCYIAKTADKVEKPKELEELVRVSKVIARDFDDVRVDLYAVDGRVLVGEITHVPNRSFGRFFSMADEERFSKLYFGDD